MVGFRRSGAESSRRVSLQRNRRLVALASILAVIAGFGQLARPMTAKAAVGDISTFAGTGNQGFSGDGGPATSAELSFPQGVAEDSAGNVYISDLFNNRIRKVDPTGTITTYAGNGTAGYSGDGGLATSAELDGPEFLAVDAAGNLYIADARNNAVREVGTNGIINTVAGNGTQGYSGDHGPATSATLSYPFGIVALPGGGFLFSDNGNEVVRKVDASGTITTFAGNGGDGYAGDGGPATSAEFSGPGGLAVDPAGDVFIADYNNDRVRKVDTTGTITTFAGNGNQASTGDGGPATSAALAAPLGLAVSAGNVFDTDSNSGLIRKIDPGGVITTVAGQGGQFSQGTRQLAADASGRLLVADSFGNVVTEVSLGPNLLTLTSSAPSAVKFGQTYAYTLTVGNIGGAGTATGVSLSDPLPTGVTFVSATASSGTCSLSGATVGCSLGSLSPQGTITVTITVTAPTTSSTPLSNTATVSASPADPYAADNSATSVTLVNVADLSVAVTATPSPATPQGPLTYTATVHNAGPADATGAAFSDSLPANVTFSSATSSQGSCAQSSGMVTCSLGTVSSGATVTITIGVVASVFSALLTDVANVTTTITDFNPANNTATVQTNVTGAFGTLLDFAGDGNTGSGGNGGPAPAANLDTPTGVAFDAAGNAYIAEHDGGRIRKVDPSGIITTFAGGGTNGYSGDGGPAIGASINEPGYVAVDAAGNVYFADTGNNVVREVKTSGIISTVAGDGTAGYSGDGAAATSAKLNSPQGLVTLPGGGFLVTDTGNNVVRKVDAAGTITTIAGNGTAAYAGDGGAATAAELNAPVGLALDPAGELFIADQNNNAVRKVGTTGTITTVAGTGTAGFSGDGGQATSAQLTGPAGLAIDGGRIFVSDRGNFRIREIDPSGIITTIAGNGVQGYGGDPGVGGPALLASLVGPEQLAIDSSADLLFGDDFPLNRVLAVSTAAPDLLHLSMSAPQDVASGSSFAISLTLANPGGVGDATGVLVSDTLPSGLTVTGASSTKGTCNVAGGTVSCAIGAFPALSVANVTLDVTAPNSSVALTNTATATANETDPALGDNSATATTFVDPADISVSGSASPSTVLAGNVDTFTISVQNAGPTAATGVALGNALPPGVTIQSASSSQGSCATSGQTVNCNLGAIGVGGSATATLGLVPAPNVAQITDNATLSGNQVDPNPGNNTATVQAGVILGVATVFPETGNTPIIPGQALNFFAGITAGADGNMWYGRLFPNNGEYQSEIGRVSTKGVFQPAYTANQSFIESIVEGPDGNVWFDETGFSGDPGGSSVGRITPQGKVTLFPLCPQVNCGISEGGQTITAGPDGNLWVANEGQGAAVRVTPKGVMTSFPVPGGLNEIAAGPDGNVWFNNATTKLGRITPTGVVTTFQTNMCQVNSPVTGPDGLLWVMDPVCNQMEAFKIVNGQPKLVAQFSTAGSDFAGTVRGKDAVYFGETGPLGIGRATTKGIVYYNVPGEDAANLAAAPDGNIWFSEFGSVSFGYITPPPSGTVSGTIIGHPVSKSTNATKSPFSKSATAPDPRHRKPHITGAECADVINPAQGTVINGDVTVSDNGFGCILSQVTVNGNVHISAGAFADLSFSTINGSVIVDTGGQAHIVGSHVTGSVTGTGSSFITVFNSKVDHDLTSNPATYGVAMICGTTVGGNFTDSAASDTTFPSTIGDPTGPIPCAGNKITGNMTLSGNAEQIIVHGNIVGGSIVVTNNSSTAPFDIRNNKANSLSCSGNAVAPTGGGNHGAATGQCAGL